ncbi:hypothetical protein PROFUN_10532 [Planoprotostelium fungivorum]|uniref:Uncharacterized protein n=1 Tax=Planoprotostelium fungivorum TaxID=1890364 RepID=A0A2P6NDD3_9EUKA|nr:hypothetical protein PROFUN_10532 [Planoprotostelium fungivorum]
MFNLNFDAPSDIPKPQTPKPRRSEIKRRNDEGHNHSWTISRNLWFHISSGRCPAEKGEQAYVCLSRLVTGVSGHIRASTLTTAGSSTSCL